MAVHTESRAFGRMTVEGERRAALIEATTALEVAIADFCRSPNGKYRYGARVPRAEKSASNLLTEIGKTIMLQYVFPVLFEEEEFPGDLIKKCIDANTTRNNIIHNRQRDVAPDEVEEYLTAIRDACTSLHAFTQAAPCSE